MMYAVDFRVGRRGLFKVAGALIAGLAGLKSIPQAQCAQVDIRDEAIRRLALGLDIPSEILTAQGGMNHWSSWAGGWCAPSSTYCDISPPGVEAFLALPEPVVVRGGVRFPERS